MTEAPQQNALYPSRSGAGAMLGRQLYQRIPSPSILLGITPSGVEIAASASQAMGCRFDVIVGAHVRMDKTEIVGAMAEDGDAIIDQRFEPGFSQIDALQEAVDRARRVIKSERVLFRGQRAIKSLEGMNVVVVDGHVTSPWKLLAAAIAAKELGALRIWAAAAVSTQSVQERIRARRIEFVCPSILMDAKGHALPFGDANDPSAERLKSIVVARQAA